jgi:hypothetical protein
MAQPIGERRWLTAFCIIVALAVAAAMIVTLFGYPAPPDIASAALLPLLVATVWTLIGLAIWIARLWSQGVESPLAVIDRAALERGAAKFLVRMVPPAAAAAFSLWFGVLKQLVPSLGGFRMDAALSRIDHILFLGHDPWRLAHAAFHPYAGLIDNTYAIWLPVLIAFPYATTIFAPAAVRARFFLTWVLTWVILGVLLAVALASAGPMFLENMRLPGAEHYKGLLAGLPETPIASKIHDYLWYLHDHGRMLPGGGISAAPSMHVAMAWLYVLTTWRWWKPLAVPAIGFFFIICVGSVYLGYHYAFDGLISIAGVSVLWSLVGRWIDGHPVPLVGFRIGVGERQPVAAAVNSGGSPR